MMERMDAVLAAEPRLTFALPFDLNAFAPAHNSVFSRDCTGDPQQDLAINRTKRFFLDSAALTRAARMESRRRATPAAALALGDRARPRAPRATTERDGHVLAPDLRARHRCGAHDAVGAAVREGPAVRRGDARLGPRAL